MEKEHDSDLYLVLCFHVLYHGWVLCIFLQRLHFVSSSLLESLLRCICSLDASDALKLNQRKTSVSGRKISLSEWLPVAEVYVSGAVASRRHLMPVYHDIPRLALEVGED